MSPSQSELIAILANRKAAPQGKQRPQNAPAMPQLGGRKTVAGTLSRSVNVEPSSSSNDFATQQTARYAPYSHPNTHGTGNIWYNDATVLREGQPLTVSRATDNGESSQQTKLFKIRDIQQKLQELLDSKAGSEEKMQEVREAVKQMAEMYPMAGQDTLDPNFTFSLPSA
ncbi:hypothetical protein RJ55_06808 [Drechmeria coniospora]|nr:hypothetical protein RJ55_06808 [Drechmeria coniospora]